MTAPHEVAKLPLFVFGTLRCGHRNHHYLQGRYRRVIPATLLGYRRLHELMIAPSPDGVVDGELFFLDSDDYASTLAGCDELEEIPAGQLIGHEYQRKLVSVETNEGTVTAWAYVQPEPADAVVD
jgi:gamma-glutamylcyclotransferase (GGCT)/AIG2-like uncharacterized protein YtfP